MFLLREKIKSLNSIFDDYTYNVDFLNDITLAYVKLDYKDESDTQRFMNEYKEIRNDIKQLKKDMIDTFKDKDLEVPEIGLCQFKNHCEKCSNNNDINAYNFCYDNCDRCKLFRRLSKNETDSMITQYFNEHISKVPKQLKERKKASNIININNNNLNINNNNLTININNYIQTKDSFFHVIITSTHANAYEKLRYIFTYLMCGISGKTLFPHEKKHSKAITFSVAAAKYNIITDNNNHTLYGVLRYKYHNVNSMTIKKLEHMGDNNHIVKAYEPNLYNHNKKQLLKNDIDLFIGTVMNSDNGSNIEDFYIEDVN